eukprot:3940849-Rhodomonas_salina.2
MRGTELGYGATRRAVLSSRMVLREERPEGPPLPPPPSTLPLSLPLRLAPPPSPPPPPLAPALPATTRCPIGLRARYAVSGTDLAYALICLRACYAMSGTDPVYLPTHVVCDARY